MAAITGSGRPVGLRPADLPGKPARHRDLPLGPRIETLSHGLPPAGPALDAGRCQRKARLAYPCGVGPAAHHPGEDAVRRRRTGVGPDQYRLRPGLDDHRSVPVLSVGALPHHQGGGEDAHAARPAGQHSEFYPHLGWQAARRSCPRYALAGSRSHLRRGSWLRRLCPPLCVAPSRGLLRHACQVEHRCSSRLSAPTDRSTGIICDQTISLDGATQGVGPLPRSGQTSAATICRAVHIFGSSSSRHVGEPVKTQGLPRLRPRRHRQRLDLDASLYAGDPPISLQRFANNQPIDRFLTGH